MEPAGAQPIHEPLRVLPGHMKYWGLQMDSNLIVRIKAIKVLEETGPGNFPEKIIGVHKDGSVQLIISVFW